MQPDSSTPSQQGTGNPKSDKTDKTVPQSEIPEENCLLEGVDEEPTQGATPKQDTQPLYHHLEPRPERGINKARTRDRCQA